MQASLKVGTGLFRMLGEKMYRENPAVILPRELIQNSLDAHTRAGTEPDILLTIDVHEDNSATIICDDKGIGMTVEQIVNDFLAAGESSYEKGDDELGGFHIAKIVLFAAKSFMVHTLNHRLDQTLNITDAPMREGTMVMCKVASGKVSIRDVRKAVWLLALSEIDIELRVSHCGEEWFNGRIGMKSDAMAGFTALPDANVFEADLGPEYSICGETPQFGRFDKAVGYSFVRASGLVQFIERQWSLQQVNLMVDVDVRGLDPQSSEYPFTVSREELNGVTGRKVSSWLQSKSANVKTTEEAFDKAVVEEKKPRLVDVYIEGKNIGSDCERAFDYDQEDDVMVDVNTGEVFDVADIEEIERMIETAKSEGAASRALTALEHAKNEDDEQATRTISGAPTVRMFFDAHYEQRYGRELDIHGKLLSAWSTILDPMLQGYEAAGIGFTVYGTAHRRGGHEAGAYYTINPDRIPRGLKHSGLLLYLWHCAVHLMAHRDHYNHNESMTFTEHNLAAKTADTLADLQKNGRLRGLLLSISRFYS